MRTLGVVVLVLVPFASGIFGTTHAQAQGSQIGGPAAVEHALVETPGGNLDLWQDSATRELALKLEGENRVTLVQDHVLLLVEGGSLIERASYVRTADLWGRVAEEYGISEARARAALAHGETVPRPKLMSPPRPQWHDAGTYTVAKHYGPDVRDLRKSVGFWVPGTRSQLLGMRFADAQRTRVFGPNGADTGLMAEQTYSADPARLGTGERELLAQSTPHNTRTGKSDEELFRNSREKLTGTGLDARFVHGELLFAHRGSYVVLAAQNWIPTRAQWRQVLAVALS